MLGVVVNKYILMIVAVVFIFVGTGVISYNIGLDTKDKEWQKKWDAAQVATLTLALQQQNKINAVTVDGEKRIEQVKSDAIAADHAADGLRGTVANLRKQRDSAVTRASKAEAAAANLHAELLIQSDAMAGKFAVAADEARQRGLTCEMAYDALLDKNKAP